MTQIQYLYMQHSMQKCPLQELSETMLSRTHSSLLLIQGIDQTEGQEDINYIFGYIFGSILQYPWTKESPPPPPLHVDKSRETITGPIFLFQLSPVYRIYRTNDTSAPPQSPSFTSNALAFGKVFPNDEKTDVIMEDAQADGTTSLILNQNLDEAIFEHGKPNFEVGDEEDEFEGFSPYGVGVQGITRIQVQKLEVWGHGKRASKKLNRFRMECLKEIFWASQMKFCPYTATLFVLLTYYTSWHLPFSHTLDFGVPFSSMNFLKEPLFSF